MVTLLGNVGENVLHELSHAINLIQAGKPEQARDLLAGLMGVLEANSIEQIGRPAVPLTKFHQLISGSTQYPVQLAYGYTVDRETIHINLYPDRISRVVTKPSEGPVVSRLDMTDMADLARLINPHKRFYPNTVHPVFVQVLSVFDLSLTLVNVDAVGFPRFEFQQ